MIAPWNDGTPALLTALTHVCERREGRDVLVLIDGLGAHALIEHRAYVRALRPAVNEARILPTILPSTTASVLASYFTGISPLEHGVLGYTTFNASGTAINQLKGEPGLAGEQWRGGVTHGERMRAAGRNFAHVGPARYRGSFLTHMLQSDWPFFGYRHENERLNAMRSALTSVGADGLVYIHIPDIDKAGHHAGPDSQPWRTALEHVDSLIGALMRLAPPGTRLTVVSDHGMLAAAPSRILDLAHCPIASSVAAVAGEGRALMVRFSDRPAESGEKSAAADAVRDTTVRLRSWVGERGQVLDSTAMRRSGLLGPMDHRLHHPDIYHRMGDAFILANEDYQFTDTRHISPAALAQRGVHGGASETEMLVPLWETVL